jgi:hypothetical protein
MKYLVMLIIGASPCYGQFFNGTIQDVQSGRVQVFNGYIPKQYMTRHEEIMESYRVMGEYFEAARQRRYQAEQLRLLREIADK